MLKNTFSLLGAIRDVILTPLPVEDFEAAYAPVARPPQPMVFERFEPELFSAPQRAAAPIDRVPPHLRARSFADQQAAVFAAFSL
jgi:hypothetical protein